MLSILICLYIFLLGCFLVFSNPVYCSVLLMLNASIVGLIIYLVSSVGWFSLLLCMVYLGGVYIIILFVSSYTQNDYDEHSSKYLLVNVGCFWALFFSISFLGLDFKEYNKNDSLELINSFDYCNIYLSYCFILLSLFFMLGVVLSSRGDFVR